VGTEFGYAVYALTIKTKAAIHLAAFFKP